MEKQVNSCTEWIIHVDDTQIYGYLVGKSRENYKEIDWLVLIINRTVCVILQLYFRLSETGKTILNCKKYAFRYLWYTRLIKGIGGLIADI